MTTPRDPAPLPRHVRALLAEYRDAHELPEEARERIWSVVGADDAPAPAFDPLEHVDDARPRRAAARREQVRWLAWGTAALAAAAVLVLAWQLGGTLAERRKASRTPGAAVMQGGGGGSAQGRASAGAEGRATTRDAESSADAGSPASSGEPLVAPAPAPSTTRPDALDPSGSTARSSPRNLPSSPARASDTRDTAASSLEPRAEPDDPEPASTDSGSTLAAERELVARAWRALALGETAQALDAAAEHARRFPAGLLAPERAAIDTIARCRRGDADGPRRATSFHRAHPRSPLAERVDEACTAAAKSSTTP